MRLANLLVGAGICVLVGPVTVGATILEEKKNEWAFELSAFDVDDVEEGFGYDFTWSWIFNRGYHELGVSISAFDEDFDDPAIQDLDGSSIGPVYQFNWTPNNQKGTGFVFAHAATIGGDLGDVFDTFFSVGIGAKVFVGNSAAVFAFYSFDQFQGASGFQDLDSTGLSVGISLYSHRR